MYDVLFLILLIKPHPPQIHYRFTLRRSLSFSLFCRTIPIPELIKPLLPDYRSNWVTNTSRQPLLPESKSSQQYKKTEDGQYIWVTLDYEQAYTSQKPHHRNLISALLLSEDGWVTYEWQRWGIIVIMLTLSDI